MNNTEKLIKYNMTEIPEGVVAGGLALPAAERPGPDDKIKWSGHLPIPSIGDRVVVSINDIGPGVVTGYFVEYNWLGVYVKIDPETRPEWHKRQCPNIDYCMAMGCEI